MAKVTSQCEMMVNAVAAGPLKLKGKFFVVEDGNGEPMIFSIDARGKLCLIMKDQSGQNVFLNLSEKFKIPNGHTVTSLAVSQNKNGKIHLCFATSEVNSTSKLHVVQPMDAGLGTWERPVLLSNSLYAGPQSQIHIKDIMLGTSNDFAQSQTLYPQLYLVFNKLDKATEDICMLIVDTQNRTWTNPNKFELPSNVDVILDKCVANLDGFRGLFVLSKLNTVVKLQFVGLDPTDPHAVLFDIPQPVPKNANCIATFENEDGLTDLLISGDALSWKSAHDCLGGSKNQTVVENTTVSDLTQMVVGQKNRSISVWALDQKHSLSYQEFYLEANGTPIQRSRSIPLLENIQGSGRFATLLSPVHGQKLFVMDGANNMKMLEQSAQTALWQQAVDVAIPNSDEMIEFQSHTVHFQMDDQNGIPIAGHGLTLLCSTSTELIVNGIAIQGSPEGNIVHTDGVGSLTIIIRSNGLSAPLLQLKDQNSSSSLFPDGVIKIDPMQKLWNTVASIKSVSDLTDMKMPDGQSFVRSNISKDDLEKACKALQDLSQARDDILSSAKAEAPSTGAEVKHTADLIANRFWGLWYWVCDKIKTGYEWSVKKLESGWEFIVEFAGQSWKFLLRNTPQVASAIQKVLETVTNGWEWIKNKLSFIFSWDDIIAVKNIFSNYMVQGFLWGADFVSDLEQKVDGYFADMRTTIQLMKTMNMKFPAELKTIQTRPQDASKNVDKLYDDALKSPQAQFGFYHLQRSFTSIEPRQPGQTTIERILIRLNKLWDQVTALANRCKINLIDLFNSSPSSINLDVLLEKLGFDLLEDILAVMQSLVTGILGSISDLIVELVDSIYTEIKIPVLGAIYKRVSSGHDLTVLDAICLCVAISVTPAYKKAIGKNPLDLPGLEQLKKQDAFKQEMDERMGRLANQTNTENLKTQSGIASYSMRLPELKPEDIIINAPNSEVGDNNDGPSHQPVIPAKEMPAMKSARLLDFKPNNITIPKTSSATATTVQTSSKQKERLRRDNDEEHRNRSRDRFAESSHWAAPILKLGGVTGGFYLYSFLTYPGLHMEPRPWTPKDVAISTAGRLFGWLLQFASLVKFNIPFRFDELFKDRWFIERFKIWGVGGISVVGQILGKAVGYEFDLISAVWQAFFLARLHIDSWGGKTGYSVYLAIEEWSKLLGKIASPIAGLIAPAGNEYLIPEVALALTTIGTSMHGSRICLEETKARAVLFTGMDIS